MKGTESISSAPILKKTRRKNLILVISGWHRLDHRCHGLLLARQARRSRRSQVMAVMPEHCVLAQQDIIHSAESRIVLSRSKESASHTTASRSTWPDVRERKPPWRVG